MTLRISAAHPPLPASLRLRRGGQGVLPPARPELPSHHRARGLDVGHQAHGLSHVVIGQPGVDLPQRLAEPLGQCSFLERLTLSFERLWLDVV